MVTARATILARTSADAPISTWWSGTVICPSKCPSTVMSSIGGQIGRNNREPSRQPGFGIVATMEIHSPRLSPNSGGPMPANTK